MKTLQELQVLILQWAKEKDLLKLENAPKQRLKLLEEVGETAGAILKNNIDEIKDGIGDIFVILVILAEQTEDFQLTDDSYENYDMLRGKELEPMARIELSKYIGFDLDERQIQYAKNEIQHMHREQDLFR